MDELEELQVMLEDCDDPEARELWSLIQCIFDNEGVDGIRAAEASGELARREGSVRVLLVRHDVPAEDIDRVLGGQSATV